MARTFIEMMMMPALYKNNTLNWNLTASAVQCLPCSALVWVDQGFSSGLVNPKQIGICCFSGKHSVSRSKNKDVLARIQDNMSKISYMSIRGLFSSWCTTRKQPSEESNRNLFSRISTIWMSTVLAYLNVDIIINQT